QKGITIDATAGQNRRYIKLAGNGTRALNIDALQSRVTLKGLIFSNGQSGDANGGGILVGSGTDLTIDNCLFDGNTTSAGTGGAIFNMGSTVQISKTYFHNNLANFVGGAIANFAEMHVYNSTFDTNQSYQGGGNISNLDGLFLNNTTVVDGFVPSNGIVHGAN